MKELLSYVAQCEAKVETLLFRFLEYKKLIFFPLFVTVKQGRKLQSSTRYSAYGSKGKWRYASSKARLECATYPRTQYTVMWAVGRLKRYGRSSGRGKLFFRSIDTYLFIYLFIYFANSWYLNWLLVYY